MTKAKEAAPAGSVYARRVDLLNKGLLKLIKTNRRKYLAAQAEHDKSKQGEQQLTKRMATSY